MVKEDSDKCKTPQTLGSLYFKALNMQSLIHTGGNGLFVYFYVQSCIYLGKEGGKEGWISEVEGKGENLEEVEGKVNGKEGDGGWREER